MKRIHCLITSSVILLFSSAIQAAPVLYNGHSYDLTPLGSWTSTEAYAITQGGHLVTIDDSTENEFIRTTFLTGPGASEDFWIGLYCPVGDWSNGANYSWVSGSASTYRNWRTGEPNLGAADGEDDRYTAINWLQTGNAQWDNYPNSVFHQPRGIFEVVPEPSAAALMLAAGSAVALGVNKRVFNRR